MGETRVDLLHLLEDLRDAYPGSLEETILTEIVANSLDSGASRISFTTDAAGSTLTVLDNGSGMKRRDLARYHDIASSTKTRGEGIGFAGVGIKLGLLVCDEVITETRRAASHVASRWHLANRHKAPWNWMQPLPGLVSENGTAVQLKVRNALSPLLDAGFIDSMLRHHFEPLFDPTFNSILQPLYGREIRFEINAAEMELRSAADGESAPLEVKMGRKRKPSAQGILFRSESGLTEDRRGIAISTYGKVIKRGWDWLGLSPSAGDRFGGAIEAPELASCLTLNKGDFIRTGPRGAIYMGYRRAIQSIVARQLAEWGDGADPGEQSQRKIARPIERDLENVLVDLADDFPILASLVEQRLGGQRKLPIGRPGAKVDADSLIVPMIEEEAQQEPRPSQEGVASSEKSQTEESSGAQESAANPGVPLPAAGGRRRPARYGLAIQFETREDDMELARLVEATVWINDAHPAYRRAVASRSEGYHLALAVAMALAPLAAQPADEHTFLTSFLAIWGESLDRTRSGKKKRNL